MNTFFAVLKNNYKRTLPRTGAFLMITLITMASVILAVYMTNKQQTFANIAVIGQSEDNTWEKADQLLHITYLDSKPPISDLYEQKYDAYLTITDAGNYKIESLKSASFQNTILALLKNPDAQIPQEFAKRSTGENIIGFMTMFLLMISLNNMFAFADDKEQGQLKRVFAAPASFGWYISAHIVYSLSMFCPQFLLLVLLKLFHISIGFSIPEYLVLIIIIGFLGSSFALLLNALFKKPDNANMLGSAITILSSILAGTFYSFSKNNNIMDTLIKLIPQKQIMIVASEINNSNIHTLFAAAYIIFFSFAMFLFSCVMLNKKYVKKSI